MKIIRVIVNGAGGGAALMMRFAAEAARYIRHVEIVEYHHDLKIDAPSGTAIKTAEYINRKAGETSAPEVQGKEMPGRQYPDSCG